MLKFTLIIVFLIINLGLINSFRLNPLLIKEFTPIKKEIKKNIKIEDNNKEIIRKVNGFYGLIGPSPKYYKNTDDYHLFDGNGMIQGIFIDNDNITYVNHWIRTDKYKYENIIKSKLPIRMDNMFKIENLIKMPFFMLLQKLNLFPNFMGTANTALWESCKEDIIYALHERDKPYKIKLDYKNKEIKTLGKENINLNYFSAHPKRFLNETLVCIYNTFYAEVELIKLDNKMRIIEKSKIKTDYINMIHDIIISEEYIIIYDTPFNFEIKRVNNKELPFFFDKEKNNKILLINKISKDVKKIECNESFFVFHNSKVEEDDNKIYIDVILHKNFDIMLDDSINNRNSKFVKLVIDKLDLSYKFEVYKELEEYNVEFPIYNNDYNVLSVFGEFLNIDGLLILKEGIIIKKIFMTI